MSQASQARSQNRASEDQRILSDGEIAELQQRFESAHPQEILAWAVDTFGERLAVVTSFQPTGIVTAHMMSQIAPGAAFLTLDTGLLFAETYALMDELEARLNLNLQRVKPFNTVEEQGEMYGDALWERNPDLCCHLRKITPLSAALNGFDAWITGLRRDQSATRANTPIVSWDKRNLRVKICPYAIWTEEMIWTYIAAYELPYNQLHDQGYPSIGCFTCTKAIQADNDLRSGRWADHSKTECGIHLDIAS